MTFYTIIFALFMVIFIGGSIAYSFYMRNKNKQAVEELNNTDFKAEFAKAESFKEKMFNNELEFLKKKMGKKPMDAVNFADIDYSMTDSLKDAMKNSLKKIATLGTVTFDTVLTPKYLVLSGDELHFFDTDKEGKIDSHYAFDEEYLKESQIKELPLEGTYKAKASTNGASVHAYKLTLKTDKKPVELVIFSSLMFANSPSAISTTKKAIKDIVVASDFLKQLGDKYPNLKVDVPILS